MSIFVVKLVCTKQNVDNLTLFVDKILKSTKLT